MLAYIQKKRFIEDNKIIIELTQIRKSLLENFKEPILKNILHEKTSKPNHISLIGIAKGVQQSILNCSKIIWFEIELQ